MEKVRREKIRDGEDQGWRKSEERRRRCAVAPGGLKVGSLKAAGAEPAGQMKDQNLHAVVARSTVASQKC